jgi:Nucleotidyl transferase AbiEii toxin, Type IV TA system
MVAEKFEAMVKLGMLNTRMKDFFDVWTISQEFAFDGPTLSRAIKATFETRGTAVPSKRPLALSLEFYDDREKNAQWKAFLNKSKLNVAGKSLPGIAEALRSFLVPVSEAVARDEILRQNWEPGGPWVVLRSRITF